MKRVRLTNDSLNSYGGRVLTSGIDIAQYERNPVLLYMHRRGDVIGWVSDIRVDDDEMTAALQFDEASELSQRCKQQFECGSLRMVSIGLDIIETSSDPQYLLPAQTSETITKSRLFEVSLVDIGANDDAMVLRRGGELFTLSSDVARAHIPLIYRDTMKEKIIQLLSLPADATEENVEQALLSMQEESAAAAALGKENESLRAEVVALQKEVEDLQSARITALVDEAVREQKLSAADKLAFVEVGQKMGEAHLSKILSSLRTEVRVSDLISHAGADGHSVYQKLSDVPADELAELKERDMQLYRELYRAEYGRELPE